MFTGGFWQHNECDFEWVKYNRDILSNFTMPRSVFLFWTYQCHCPSVDSKIDKEIQFQVWQYWIDFNATTAFPQDCVVCSVISCWMFVVCAPHQVNRNITTQPKIYESVWIYLASFLKWLPSLTLFFYYSNQSSLNYAMSSDVRFHELDIPFYLTLSWRILFGHHKAPNQLCNVSYNKRQYGLP